MRGGVEVWEGEEEEDSSDIIGLLRSRDASSACSQQKPPLASGGSIRDLVLKGLTSIRTSHIANPERGIGARLGDLYAITQRLLIVEEASSLISQVLRAAPHPPDTLHTAVREAITSWKRTPWKIHLENEDYRQVSPEVAAIKLRCESEPSFNPGKIAEILENTAASVHTKAEVASVEAAAEEARLSSKGNKWVLTVMQKALQSADVATVHTQLHQLCDALKPTA